VADFLSLICYFLIMLESSDFGWFDRSAAIGGGYESA
tara:strand:- start:548 stop:658 length:111 start_codon:yes stop_codon:yes gene_type:complete